MVQFSLRSLLVAAIVLSNCITWTASRHHYTHNVSGHRSRHRRQGKGLYLTSSYVIPGGEGTGWGEWGETTPCSRTCGGGVASQKRICLEIGPDGQPQCTGGDTKYFSCQTQDCPPGSMDFRAEQCAYYNNVTTYRGTRYKWVPYTKGPNPCELNCMPPTERFYYRHKDKVIDGTRCNDESFDVCVDGTCQPVGCDMMLGSNAREDKCRNCRGNGKNCYTASGILDTQDLIKGYNDIMLIPEGATTIVVMEVKPSNNYLALRAKNGTYYLNGDYHIDFPRSMMIAGALWYYERSQQGFAAPDKLRCLGPINEPIYVSLLLQSENVGIEYEYSLPSELAPRPTQKYNWVHEDFTPCSATCGGGFQTRNVTCRTEMDLELVDDALCDIGLKPATNQSCNTQACPAQWVAGPWEPCSKRCGEGGIQSRDIRCEKIITNGFPSVVSDKECFDLLGPKPEKYQECNVNTTCPKWFTEPWKPCDTLYGQGKQTRRVICYQKDGKRIDVLDDSECADEKPETERTCMVHPDTRTDWMLSDWVGCDTCLSTFRTRVAKCTLYERVRVADEYCAHHPAPVLQQPCDPAKLPPCEVQWYATQWGKCSVKCGEGTQSRRVFCGIYINETVVEVDEARCSHLAKYNDTRNCTVPKELCPSQWYASRWTKCSKECGEGVQSRRVMCMRGDEPATDCDATDAPESTQNCNAGPCNEDEIIPLNPKSPPILDQEDCDYDEDYPEVGLDIRLIGSSDTTLGDMLSDSPASDVGSGMTPLVTGDGFYTDTSLASEEFISSEGSGSGSSSSWFTDTTDDFTTDSTDFSTERSTVVEPTLTKKKVSSDLSAKSSTASVSAETSTPTNETESTVTESSTTEDISYDTDLDLSTTESVTDITGSTEPTATESTLETKETESTVSSVESSTTVSGETTGSEATESTVTEESGATESTDAASTSVPTDSTLVDTGSTSTEIDGKTTSEPSGTTETGGSSVTESSTTEEYETVSDLGSTTVSTSDKTESTDETKSTAASDESTATTSSGESTVSESTESTVSKEASSTEASETSESFGSTEAESTTAGTDKTTESGGTTESTVTDSSATEETSETVSESSPTTESTETTEPTKTESTPTLETEVTKSTAESETTVSGETTESAATESTVAKETSSTEASVTSEATESTIVDESSKSTIAGKSLVTDTTVVGSTESSTTEEIFDTVPEASTTTADKAATTESSEPKSTGILGTETTVSGETSEVETTTSADLSTTEPPVSKVKVDVLARSGASETSVTEPPTTESTGSEETTVAKSATTESGTTEEPTESTTSAEAATTLSSEIASTTSGPEVSTVVPEKTTVVGAETSESSTTSEPELLSTTESEWTTAATTEESGETTESSGAESTTSVMSTTEYSVETTTIGAEGITAKEGAETTTSEEITGVSTSAGESYEGTTTEGSTLQVVTTARPSLTGKSHRDWSSTVGIPSRRKCKKRKSKCGDTMFGCCPDLRTPAKGPYDEGCPRPRTCKESQFGCCPDEVSPALGLLYEGCPPSQCAETLFGCCLSDNKTAAEGNDQEGCPPPPPACKSSRYGCCADGELEAKGPDMEGCPENTSTQPGTSTETESQSSTKSDTTTSEVFTSTTQYEDCSTSEFGCCYDNETFASAPGGAGCPCNVTEFGCCADGVSPAKGVNLEGCPTSCSTSRFGCCPDGKTPAHGPDNEGCCLLYAFGCCPDNYKPAEGPHLEGCGCQYARFGCCPDNATLAKGPNNQGCGCQYTTYGCCPDRHTEATGPNYEGCGCHTYQFGCCLDGVTIAKGPNNQGCDCHQSQYGCCGDGKTPATGPERGGCDCASSEFGCCPDGQTEAKGHKFFGCSDIPVNRQAACSQPTDRGSCRNFSVYWYYDLEYGGCSRFWYGGCEGNGNRFATKEECEDVCVQPAPKDACNLPKVKGACMGYNIRWYYDSDREECSQFVFGGCLGNANNFESRELCQSQCQPTRTEDQCSLPIDRGSCAGNFGRWGFNSETRRCEQFIWGGCEGNTNRFSSEAACIQRCDPPGTPKLPDICTLPGETGDCSDYRENWFYDTAQKRCRPFYYGGCGGNANNFASEMECERRCSEPQTTTTTVQPPTEPAVSAENICFREVDPGPCTNMSTRWTYDYRMGRCIEFQYGGCGGNQNNFPTEEHCQYYCKPVQDICQLPMRAGPCEGSLMRWFYDPITDSCSQFTYGGCEGNDNRFESRDDCERRCRTGAGHDVSTTTRAPAPTVAVDNRVKETLPSECYISPSLETCVRTGQVWYLDPSLGECVSHDNPETGDSCRNTGVFPTQEACERSCGAFRNINVCRHEKDPGPCQNFVAKYYFDSRTGRCKEFAYGGCHGGPNRFSTIDECLQVCRPEIDPCKQDPEPGNCVARYTLWYYDYSKDECMWFIYGGCGGNDNRFETKADCEQRCRRRPVPTEAISTTTTTLAPASTYAATTKPIAEECRTPNSLEPCGSNITVYYYDHTSSRCMASDIGGCRYANSYKTEEECERRCGVFKDKNVCGERLDPGPCRASIPKFYWDMASGSCQSYAYGGCGGSANRFSTIDECEEVCGTTGPGTNEVLPPDCGGYDDECLQLVCPYGMARATTPEGCTKCSCVEKIVDCSALNAECDALRCPYGIERTRQRDGCEKCKCYEDPCLHKTCGRGENCVPIRQVDPITHEPRFSASCRPAYEPNEVLPDCDRYNEECARLRCDYAVQRTRAPDGCERCSCVQVEVDCTPLRLQCDTLKCNYGLEKFVGVDGCERCLCTAHPCDTKECGSGERCVATPYTDPITHEAKYSAECRTVNKTGYCPADNMTADATCRHECNDDADCRGVGKCCPRGCSQLCLLPEPLTSPAPIVYTTTHAPNLPQAPQVNHETEPEVVAAEGGKATLRCLFHGNPPPKITWRRGEITIEGDVGRYRLLSDGALEIVSLYRNDSGVYICVAENNLGVATQEIQLQVSVPVATRISVPSTSLTAGSELSLTCEVDGYPEPDVYWARDGKRILPSDNIRITGTSLSRLTISRVSLEDAGTYECHAQNAYSSHFSYVQITVQPLSIPAKCTDNPFFANCHLIVRSKFCQHKYYSKFCCKSCLEAGQLSPQEVEMQADQPLTRKKK